MRSWHGIKRKGDDVKKNDEDRQTAPESNEGGKDSDLANKSSVTRLVVGARYWDGCEDVFVMVEDVRSGPNGDCVILTGPGPDILIPVRNIRYLTVEDE